MSDRRHFTVPIGARKRTVSKSTSGGQVFPRLLDHSPLRVRLVGVVGVVAMETLMDASATDIVCQLRNCCFGVTTKCQQQAVDFAEAYRRCVDTSIPQTAIEPGDMFTLIDTVCRRRPFSRAEVVVDSGTSPTSENHEDAPPIPATPATNPASTHPANDDSDGGDADDEYTHVILLPEEMIFLQYGLGIISVYEQDADSDNVCSLSADRLFSKLARQCVDFAYRCAAYYDLRSRGWLLCYGIQYGADWLLYDHRGPKRSHAALTVTVCADRALNWRHLVAVCRVTEHVSKRTLLVRVVPVVAELDLCRLECLKSLSLEEVLMERWTTSDG